MRSAGALIFLTRVLGGLFAFLLDLSSAHSLELRHQEVEGHGGLPLIVVEAGVRGKPEILFVHGFSQSYLAFMRQFDSDLADSFHLVGFDLRGHGGSPKPWKDTDYVGSRIWADDVNAVIEATDLKAPILVGWSYGGFVVADYVRHYGVEGLAGISLVGSLGGLVKTEPPPVDEEMRKMLQRSEDSRSLSLSENLLAARATGEFLSTPNMTESERSIAFAMQLMMPAYVRRLMRGRNLDNTDLPDRFDVPVLLIRGADDIVMPEAGTNRLMEALPDVQLSTYPETGHLPFVQRHERFNEELTDFVLRVR